MHRISLLPLLALPALAACHGESPPGTPLVEPGPAQLGAAEVYLSLPVGTPLGGYTSRLLGGAVDERDSDYAAEFVPSAGVQTRIPAHAFWFSNGQEDLCVITVNLIYSFDGLVAELERRLSEDLDLDLHGRVVVATQHSHQSYGNYSAQYSFFLGGDRFDPENFLRLADSLESVALQAHEGLQEVQLGLGYAVDWDPDDEVYRDRRSENDDLQLFDDIPPGSYKDPYLWMLRADTLDGEPLAVLYGFGIHGTLGGGDNELVSVDAPGHVELAFRERFDRRVVVGHFQSGAGDASPAGYDEGFARDETIGEAAVDAMWELYQSIEVAPVELRLETRSRELMETREHLHVSRGGAVDWAYAPYESGLVPDGRIWDDDGSLLSPIDEFNAEYGAAFCGEDTPYLPGYDLGTDVYPYASCTRIEGVAALLQGVFGLSDEELALPLRETRRALLTAVRLGPLPTLFADGHREEQDLLWAFFPGETTSLYTEMFRRRARDELGFESAIPVGYAQDHEGYILLAEDWLQGGYEPQISTWGPLQGDYLMDRMVELSQALLTDELEPMDPTGIFAAEDWGPYEPPERHPDDTPSAGRLLDESPGYLYDPLSEDGPELDWPATVPRVQGLVEFAWEGGDPAVDLPRVVLEREEDGEWVAVTTPSGREVSEALPDILLAHTPDPLQGEGGTVPQRHYWLAAWQAVGPAEGRAGLPEGRYRFHVTGQRWLAGEQWPFETEPYELTTEPFTLVPGELELEVSGGDLWVSLPGPERGFRHVAPGGNARGDNPVEGQQVTATWTYADGTTSTETLEGEALDGRSFFEGAVPEGAVAVEVEDRYGNAGSLAWDGAEPGD